MANMNKIFTGAILAGFLFSGCSIMHFKNGSAESGGAVQETWHHSGIYSLIEISPLIEPKKLCPDKGWSVITTKDTFLTVLVGSADNIVIGAVVPMVPIDIWDPQALEWYCASGGAVSPAPADSAK